MAVDGRVGFLTLFRVVAFNLRAHSVTVTATHHQPTDEEGTSKNTKSHFTNTEKAFQCLTMILFALENFKMDPKRVFTLSYAMCKGKVEG